MILVLARFRLPVAAREEAREAMEQVIRLTRAEAGCHAYDCGEDVLDPGLFRVSELWTDRAALAAHAAAPHLAEWTRLREALGMTERQIDVYEVSEAPAA